MGCGGCSTVSDSTSKLGKNFSWIKKDYKSLDEVSEALKAMGLKSAIPILGFCFTQNKRTEKNLHYIGDDPNDYEKVVSIIGNTLSAICGDNFVHCFGFGDATTLDTHVFSFYEDKKPCHGFEEVVERYRQIACQMRLAGCSILHSPISIEVCLFCVAANVFFFFLCADTKSFARMVKMAASIASKNCNQHHILVIIADGPVTRSSDTEHGKLSDEEQETVDAISKASKYPLSIILVGVGEKNANMMKGLRYVNYTDIMSSVPDCRRDIEFTLAISDFHDSLCLVTCSSTNNQPIDTDWDATAPPIPVNVVPKHPV
ncbi:hypothetical protein MKX01_040003 [Papaver californicum]|nr:hypothetical protein MKX01_040003 [Papaver californicum]